LLRRAILLARRAAIITIPASLKKYLRQEKHILPTSFFILHLTSEFLGAGAEQSATQVEGPHRPEIEIWIEAVRQFLAGCELVYAPSQLGLILKYDERYQHPKSTFEEWGLSALTMAAPGI
jgi:hypothetical protein